MVAAQMVAAEMVVARNSGLAGTALIQQHSLKPLHPSYPAIIAAHVGT